MFWDGERWIDERAAAPVRESARRRGRDWLATGVMILGVGALAVPFMPTNAAVSSSHRLLESWRGSYETRVFQESTAYASYSGSWGQRQDDQYLGTYAAVSGQLGASVTFTFTGSAVSWIGPEGPDQGKAAVYVDGRLVRTVNAYSGSLRPRETLFTTWFPGLTEHTLTIEARGATAGEAASVDAFVVRGASLEAEGRLDAGPGRSRSDPCTVVGPRGSARAHGAADADADARRRATPAPTPTPRPAPTPTPPPPDADAHAHPDAAPTPTPTPRPTATPGRPDAHADAELDGPGDLDPGAPDGARRQRGDRDRRGERDVPGERGRQQAAELALDRRQVRRPDPPGHSSAPRRPAA